MNCDKGGVVEDAEGWGDAEAEAVVAPPRACADMDGGGGTREMLRRNMVRTRETDKGKGHSPAHCTN